MPTSMRVTEFSDRELLHILDDAQDGDGWANVEDIAQALRLNHPNPTRSVGARMARMKLLGATENAEGEAGFWRPTPDGETLMTGELAERTKRMLDEMDPGQVMMLTRWLTGRYHSLGSDALGLFIKREWQFGTFERRGRFSQPRRTVSRRAPLANGARHHRRVSA